MKMRDKGCYNCKHGHIDLFASTDLLFCDIHYVFFEANSFCTEHDKICENTNIKIEV